MTTFPSDDDEPKPKPRPSPMCRTCGKDEGDGVVVIGGECMDCTREWSR